VEQIGVKDSFFELGGDSLKAIKLCSVMKKSGFNISIKYIMSGKTPENISAFLKTQISNTDEEIVKIIAVDYSEDEKNISKAESFINNSIVKYRANISFCNAEIEYNPSYIQSMFIKTGNTQLCCSTFEVSKLISSDQIINGLKRLIKEQSALRSVYNEVKNTITEFDYSDDWWIPYFEEADFSLEHELGALIHSKKLIVANQLQSFITVLKMKTGVHRVYLYIHHCLWDAFSATIFKNRLNKLISNGNEHEQISFSKYVESISNNKIDCDNNIINFCNIYDGYRKQLNGEIEKNMLKCYNLIIQSKVKKDVFQREGNDIIKKIMLILSSVNENLNCLENIPFELIYHGRFDYNDNMLGVKLLMLPSIYQKNQNVIIGGIEYLNDYDKVPDFLLEDRFNSSCYTKEGFDLTLNLRMAFGAEIESSNLVFQEKIDIIEGDEAILSCDYLDGWMNLCLPVFIHSDRDKNEIINKITENKIVKNLFGGI
ncbi:MAG: hypothetical protein GX638_07010, partial [Crenarchaeota archaeon]|nr:hypothetical protein [Thermoproteota archaeon]